MGLFPFVSATHSYWVLSQYIRHLEYLQEDTLEDNRV